MATDNNINQNASVKKAVFYGRFSSDRQSEQSIEGQREVCQNFAKNNNIIIVKEYIDRALTGKNDNRPKFREMIANAPKADWDFVLIYAIDRFGRNAIEIAVNKYALKKTGKTYISATQRTSDNVDGTKNLDGIILENVYIGMAEYYSEELTQKVKRGQLISRGKGNYTGGGVMYGYIIKGNKTDGKKWTVVPEQASVVIDIFTQYSEGRIVRDIVDNLNAKGLTNKDGNPFVYNSIYSMLHNEKYTGVVTLGGITYTNIIPRIIPQDLWNRVKKITDNNKLLPNNKKAKDYYYLGGKLFCGYCGGAMNGESGIGRKGCTYQYYKCANKKKKRNDCSKKAVPKQWIEDIVLDATLKATNNVEIVDFIATRASALNEENIANNLTLAALKKERSNAQTSINNLVKAIESGIINKYTQERLMELETTIENIDEAIKIEEIRNGKSITKEAIAQYIMLALSNCNADERYKRRVVALLINKIELFDDKIIIYFNYTAPDDNKPKVYTVNEKHPDGSPSFDYCPPLKT